MFLGIVRQGGPDNGSVMSSGQFELFFDVALAGLAAMALGLLISAFVSNGDKALTILPVILFAEFLFTGSAFPVNKTPGLAQASYLASAKWGYSAAASTADADVLLGHRLQRHLAARTAARRQVRRDAGAQVRHLVRRHRRAQRAHRGVHRRGVAGDPAGGTA